MVEVEVSVVIPVYNAERYIEEAVDSALKQPETAEVVLVEDGSTDRSLAICEDLCSRHQTVILHTHEGNGNLGAGATRNLGIVKATKEFVAFLDADDIYADNRFVLTREVFNDMPEADGVYEVIGVRYFDDSARIKHLKRMKLAKSNIAHRTIDIENTGVEPNVDFTRLFTVLMTGSLGWIHLGGLTLKRKSLFQRDLFDTRMRLGQDADFILRLALAKKLFGTNSIKPVAYRGVHDENRILADNLEETRKYQMMGAENLLSLLGKKSFGKPANRLIIKNYVWKSSVAMDLPPVLLKPLMAFQLVKILLVKPRLLARVV